MSIHIAGPPLSPDELIDIARQGEVDPQDESTDGDHDEAAVARLLLAAAKLASRANHDLHSFGELAMQAFIHTGSHSMEGDPP